MEQAIAAARHIKTNLPAVARIVDALGILAVPKRSRVPLPTAVTKIVVGQMLSGQVADVIYARIRAAMRAHGVSHAWKLNVDVLRECGLSGRKIRTLYEFGAAYESNRNLGRAWPKLPYDALVLEVGRIWGLGEWSAAMLGIAYYGHEDIFPMSDGSLVRAIRLLATAHPKSAEKFDPSLASPYKTYLARYLWSALDSGVLTR